MKISDHAIRLSTAIMMAAALFICNFAYAAQIIIVNADSPGVGLTDATPATPEGGNSGTTLGQQRTILLQRVAAIWGSKLESSVPIRVRVSFTDNSPCQNGDPNAFVYLASSGPTGYYTVSGPPYPPGSIVYPAALRNAIVGTVADPSTPEISILINPKMDTVPNCIDGYSGYWYGIDPDIPAPIYPATQQFPILTLLLHEMGHGLGFIEGVDLSNGHGFPPYRYIYNTLLYDTQIGKFWTDMSDSERVTSSTNDPNLIWTGEHVDAAQDRYMRQPLRVRSGSTVQPGDVLQAYFGHLLPRNGLSAQARLVNDGSGDTDDGCSALTNAAQVQGRIALIKRGTCAFSQKVKNAENAGAIAALVLNDRAETPADPLPILSGSDFTVHLPTVSVSYQAGLNLISVVGGAPATVVTVEPIPGSANVGTQNGHVRMHAPATLAVKSSVSHYTSDSATPLLMQSAINYATFDRTDMTEALLQDMGWQLNEIFKDGFEGN